MGFEAVARVAAAQPWKAKRDGEGDGRSRNVHFRDPIWDRLKLRCEEHGISVSRFLQTLAVMSLEEDER